MASSSGSPSCLHDHFVQFYDKDEFLIEEVSNFLAAGLGAGQAAVFIATASHREELARRLSQEGVPTDSYFSLDAQATLSHFLLDGWPDESRFAEIIGGILRQASDNGRRGVRAFGEMVALLWSEGRHAAAVRLEELWNDLGKTHSFSLLCAYPMAGFKEAENDSWFREICDAHGAVQPAESFVETPDSADLRRQVAQLQQKAAALAAEVARRQQIERDLRRREQELADFLENAVEGIHRVGADGTILWANRAELEMLGYERDEYVGRHISEFHVDREVVADMLGKLQRGEALYDHPSTMRCRDGSVKHVLVHSNALLENGELIHTRCFTRDVTEKVRLQEELARKLEQLAEQDRRKSEFLALLGHELRNPLAAIVTATELLRLRSDDPEKLDRAGAIIARQSSMMVRLVDDLLDVSRIDRGKIELRLEPVAIGEIVERAVELVRPMIDERGHRLSIDLPPSPLSLFGDPARLVQILTNLLQNAAKYTHPGGCIELQARQEGSELLLGIRDNGVGMTPALQERVFEPFVQAPRSLDRSEGGLGLGLALVRALVELHGGSVSAASEGPGRGSEFVVRLPASQEPRG